MDIQIAKSFFLWCTIFNFSILLLWMFLLSATGDWFYSWQMRWFPMTREQAVRCNYLLYGTYKLAVLLLNAIPWLALQLIA